MGLRNVQSSHVLQSFQQGQHGPPPADDNGAFRPSSWDNSASPLSQLFSDESLQRGNNAEVGVSLQLE